MKYSTHLFILIWFFIQSCSGAKTAPEPDAAIEESNAITLTQDQLKALGLQYGDPVKTSMSSIITVQGKIDLPPAKPHLCQLSDGRIPEEHKTHTRYARIKR